VNRILSNKNIVITRGKDQAIESINTLRELGANVISFPTIKITPIKDNGRLEKIFQNIYDFDTVIFSSENAVKFFLSKMNELIIDLDLTKFFIISIGDKTTEFCNRHNIKVGFQALKFSFNDLVNELSQLDLSNRNILIPSSNLSNKERHKTLEKFGANVTFVPIYQNIVTSKNELTKEIQLLNETDVDLFIFTSPSTFNGFLEILDIDNPPNYFAGKNVAVIGPVTKNELNKKGIEPNIIPQNYSMKFLIEEIKSFFSKNVYLTE
jgi:uroporphyrinogen-III synthase